ncbi:ferritin-like domain-containing protein [Deinococcus sp. UYEF24]
MSENSNPSVHPTRRRVLRTLVGTGGLLASGVVSGLAASTTTLATDPLSLLNQLATQEALLVTFYHAVLDGAAFSVTDTAADQLKTMLDTQRQHLQLLLAQGGRPQATSFALPEQVTADASVFVSTGQYLEQVSAATYVAATHDFAVLGRPALAATAAQFGAAEAQHLAQLSHLAGFDNIDLRTQARHFGRAPDGLLALKRFIRPGKSTGPLTPFPTSSQLSASLDGRLGDPARLYLASSRRTG